MTRYIDADALKKSIDEHVYLVNHGFNETEYGCTQYGIHQIIDDAPTIDAVPVIRCNACRYWSSEDGKSGYCNGFNLVYRKYDADYYCATAEPKEHDD